MSSPSICFFKFLSLWRTENLKGFQILQVLAFVDFWKKCSWRFYAVLHLQHWSLLFVARQTFIIATKLFEMLVLDILSSVGKSMFAVWYLIYNPFFLNVNNLYPNRTWVGEVFFYHYIYFHVCCRLLLPLAPWNSALYIVRMRYMNPLSCFIVLVTVLYTDKVCVV